MIISATVKDTTLIDYDDYMRDVIQTFLYDLEETGLYNLRMRDFSMKFK